MDTTHLPLPLRTISVDRFAPYGQVIDLQGRHEDGYYEVIVEEPMSPWKIAMYEFDRKSTRVLERHPASKESFEPHRGIAILLVAVPGTVGVIEAFLLDVPVCLNAGVWHQVISLSDFSQVKITENITVTSEFHELPFDLFPGMCARTSPRRNPVTHKEPT